MSLENAISPEWFGVAKAVSYLLGAACCLFCHWMGFKAGKVRGHVEGESQAAKEWLKRFRKYALGVAQTKPVLGTPIVPGPDAGDFTKASSCKVCGREDCLWAGEEHLTVCECFRWEDRP